MAARTTLAVRELVESHISWLVSRNYAPATVSGRRAHLREFHKWCLGEGSIRLRDVTPAVLEDYQRWIGSLCRSDGAPLTVATRVNKLVAVRMLLAWATRSLDLRKNPARFLELPRMPRRLPRAVLTESEVERVLTQPDCSRLMGVCDRAILETLYSTGLRRVEIVSLNLADLDPGRGTVFVRAGKGDRDRVVPIGNRALEWISRYRHLLVAEATRLGASVPPHPLFLNARWKRIRATKLTERLRRYIVAAGIDKPGSVHIYRHTMATHMHDNGADIRDLQELLGHAQLSTTEIYTHVSIGRLKHVHARTHPAERGRG